MAELKVFGMPGCARCQGVKQYLSSAGQSVRVGDTNDTAGFEAAIRKALKNRPANELISAEKSRVANRPDRVQNDALATSLSKHPERLVAPLVVRGHQVVVANRQDQAGALRY